MNEVSLPEELQNLIAQENMIWDFKAHRTEDVVALISKMDPIYFQGLLNWVSIHRFFHYKLLYEIIQNIDAIMIKFNKFFTFPQYLYLKGFLKDENFDSNGPPEAEKILDLHTYEEPLKKDSIEYYIYHDDVTNFARNVTLNNIDMADEFIHVLTHGFFLLDFACFCGSIKIVKYMLINEVIPDELTVEQALKGGDEEIILLLQAKGFNFDNLILYAIEYHSNKIADWLFENYKHDYFNLSQCIQYYDTELFFLLLDNGMGENINSTEIYSKKTCLTRAAEINNIPLIKFLLQKGASKTVKDALRQTPFHYARSEEAELLLDVDFDEYDEMESESA